MSNTTNKLITHKEYWDYVKQVSFFIIKDLLVKYPLDDLLYPMKKTIKTYLKKVALDFAVSCEFLDNKGNYNKILTLTNNFPTEKELKIFNLKKDKKSAQMLSVVVMVGDIVDEVCCNFGMERQ